MTERPMNVVAAAAVPIYAITMRVDRFVLVTGISKGSVYRMLANGDIAAVKLGGKTLILMDSYRKLLARSKPYHSVSYRPKQKDGIKDGLDLETNENPSVSADI